MDKQHVTLLVLLNLSAAFDTKIIIFFWISWSLALELLTVLSLYLYQQNPIWRVSFRQSVITIGVSHKVPV